MSSRFKKLVIAVVVMLSLRGFAQNRGEAAATSGDQRLYCEYVLQQAEAQRDLLRAPSAFSGVTQPSAALPAQAVWGITTSLSDMKKAGLTMDAARKHCELYGATTEAQQDIQYALPGLESQELRHRLELIQQAYGKL